MRNTITAHHALLDHSPVPLLVSSSPHPLAPYSRFHPHPLPISVLLLTLPFIPFILHCLFQHQQIPLQHLRPILYIPQLLQLPRRPIRDLLMLLDGLGRELLDVLREIGLLLEGGEEVVADFGDATCEGGDVGVADGD